MNFFNDKLIFYTQNEEEDDRYQKKYYDGSCTTYKVPVYEADLDGKNPKKVPVEAQAGDVIYSDGNHLVISNDNLLSITKKSI